jgi:hypothetical protein
LVIRFTAHLQLEITSSYNATQVSITHIRFLSLSQPPLVVAWLQSSNKGYSSHPYSSRTALSNRRLKTVMLCTWLPACLQGRSGKLLLVFASTVIPGLSALEIHDQGFCSLLDMMRLFIIGASSSTREGLVFLCRRYVCCTVVSARVYPRCHSVQVSMDCVHPLSLHYTK